MIYEEDIKSLGIMKTPLQILAEKVLPFILKYKTAHLKNWR